MDAFVATVNVEDAILRDSNSDGSFFQLTSSTFNLNRIDIKSVTQTNSGNAIFKTSLESNVLLNGIYITNSNVQLFLLRSSNVVFNNLTVINVDAPFNFGKILDGLNTTLTNFYFDYLWTKNGYSIYIRDTKFYLMENFVMNDFQKSNFRFIRCTVDKMNNITVTKTKNQGFKVEHSNFNSVSNSYFGQNGRVGFLRGFFWNYNSNFTFVNVTFDGNTAKQGANFYYE